MSQFSAAADMAATLITAQFGGVSLTVEREPTATDGRGHPTGEWQTVASTDDAIVEPIGGTERWLAEQAQSQATHRVTMPYVAGVTSAMRLNLGSGRILAIEAARDVADAGVLLEIDAIESDPRTT